MIEFATEPDSIFLVIVEEALRHVATDLYPFVVDARPTTDDLAEVDEHYQFCYRDLARFFPREQARAVIAQLDTALRAPICYGLTDFHWLVAYRCLEMFCDLHNDGALAGEGNVGPYIIDKIDFDAIVGTFFFDTDFLFGAEFIVAREHGRKTPPGVTPEAAKIAAGARPDARDLELTPIDVPDWDAIGDKVVPKSGYVGPYPMREREQGE